jgi:hypothetical protein
MKTLILTEIAQIYGGVGTVPDDIFPPGPPALPIPLGPSLSDMIFLENAQPKQGKRPSNVD